MLTHLPKLLLTLVLVTGFSLFSNAQTWAVGVPLNQVVISNFAFKSQFQLPGCFPQASVNFNFFLPSVSGVQYYLKVTSIDANSAYMMPGNDTLAVGDSIAVNGGTNTKSIYYYAATASTDFKAALYAAGTPTTAGQPYPYNIVNQAWISNLMICNEGLSAQVSAACTVQNNPTSVASTRFDGIHYSSPTSSNNYQFEFNEITSATRVQLYTLTGSLCVSQELPIGSSRIDGSMLPSGIYLMVLSNGNETKKEKVLITK